MRAILLKKDFTYELRDISNTPFTRVDFYGLATVLPTDFKSVQPIISKLTTFHRIGIDRDEEIMIMMEQ